MTHTGKYIGIFVNLDKSTMKQYSDSHKESIIQPSDRSESAAEIQTPFDVITPLMQPGKQ